MVELHKIVNNSFDNETWKQDLWNMPLLFYSKEHNSAKNKKDFPSKGKHISENRLDIWKSHKLSQLCKTNY